MIKYKITAYVGFDSPSKIVEAKNFDEAYRMALDFGHCLSGFGEGPFLSGVHVQRIKKKNK